MFGAFITLASAAVPLKPIEPWQVTSGNVGCSAIRSYGTAPRAAVAIQRDIHNPQMIIAVEAAASSLPKGRGQVDLKLNPGGTTFRVGFGAFAASDQGYSVVRMFPEPPALAALSTATEMQVGDGGAVFLLSSVEKARLAIEKCNRELLQSWGVDPELYTQGRLAVPLNAGRWFSDESYPREAKARHITGRVVLLLQTLSDGNLRSCKVVVPSDPALDDASCAIAMRKVQVRPPVDEQGKSMPSYAVLPVRWGG